MSAATIERDLMAAGTFTIEELRTLRALHLDRVNAWHDETLERVVAAEGWLVELGRSYAGRHFASTETWCRTIDERASDARAIVRTPIRSDWAQRKNVARSIKSRGRFLAWYVAAFNARRAAEHRHVVAADAAGALRYPDQWGNALVDIDRVTTCLGDRRNDVYAVTPRDAVPYWEPRDVKPYKVPAVKPYAGTAIALYGAARGHELDNAARGYKRITEPVELPNGETVERLVGIECPNYVPRSMVPSGVYLESTSDPMQYNAGNMHLELEARDFLKEHGESMPLPDRYMKGLYRWQVKPDRAAYRGKVRFARKAPMRYQHGYKRIGRELIPALDKVAIGKDSQRELETRLAAAYQCHCGPLRTVSIGVTFPRKVRTPLLWRGKLITRGTNPDRDKCTCERRGWIGHRAVMFESPAAVKKASDHTARTVKRAAASVAREIVGAGKRGPAITPWLLSERSLPTASERVRESWEVIEQVIRTNVDGSDIEMTDGTVITVIGSAQVFDHHRGRAYPVREWCRRYALQHAADSVA